MDSPAQPVASPEPVVAPPEVPVETSPGPDVTQIRPIANSLGSDLIASMQSLLGTIVIAVFVITFIVQAFQIPSPSMENTLLIGDYLLVNKLCYGGGGVADLLMPYRRAQRGAAGGF